MLREVKDLPHVRDLLVLAKKKKINPVIWDSHQEGMMTT